MSGPAKTSKTAAAVVALLLLCPLAAQLTVSQTVESVRESHRTATAERLVATLPIGVFDSGTGGLAVLEEVLHLDQFNNETNAPGPDGWPDFGSEDFVFLADQANMPYGNYPAAGKTAYLVDLALNDAIFLLTREYYIDARATRPKQDRLPAKAILIACNTATAYGKKSIESFIAETRVGVSTIDVITGGARGALEHVAKSRGGTIGVIATQGTCLSNPIPLTVKRLPAEIADRLHRRLPSVWKLLEAFSVKICVNHLLADRDMIGAKRENGNVSITNFPPSCS